MQLLRFVEFFLLINILVYFSFHHVQHHRIIEHFQCNIKTSKKQHIHLITLIKTTVTTLFHFFVFFFLFFKLNLGFLRDYYVGGHYTLANIHDNTLFFHVESNFGVRRSDFVKRLSDYIGFLAVSKADVDRMHFVDETGTINTRHFHNDYCLPRDVIPSPEEWHANPNYHASVRLLRPLLQTMTYQLRMGLSHMFSTGFC